jgi:hypothetical protein
MRVKIGNIWYDAEYEPICIQVSEGEQKQIAEMDRAVATQGKYAVFPDRLGWSSDQMLAWMDG